MYDDEYSGVNVCRGGSVKDGKEVLLSTDVVVII